jgi:hypothetical protein
MGGKGAVPQRFHHDNRRLPFGFPYDTKFAFLTFCVTVAQRPLYEHHHGDHLLFIEFRPNDLASPRIARLTDDLPPRISNKLVAI